MLYEVITQAEACRTVELVAPQGDTEQLLEQVAFLVGQMTTRQTGQRLPSSLVTDARQFAAHFAKGCLPRSRLTVDLRSAQALVAVEVAMAKDRITSYNVCYTKLLR